MSESAEQLDLLPDDQFEAVMVESERARGIFSGEGLRAADPARYALLRELVLDGALSQVQIARACKCSRNTVRAVMRREVTGRAVDQLKSRLAAQALTVAAMTSDAMIERLSDPEAVKSIPFQQLAVAHGISVDKLQVLTGAPTSIVGDAAVQPGAGDPDAFVEELRRRKGSLERTAGAAELGAGPGERIAEGVTVGPARPAEGGAT